MYSDSEMQDIVHHL